MNDTNNSPTISSTRLRELASMLYEIRNELFTAQSTNMNADREIRTAREFLTKAQGVLENAAYDADK